MLGTQKDLEHVIWNYLAPIKCITLAITNKCCFTCEHCNQAANMKDFVTMKKETVEQICEGLEDHYLELHGGEAFLEPELLLESIKIGRKNKMKIMISTSGYMADDNELFKILLLADYVAVSIDPFHRKAGISMEKVDRLAERLEREKPILFGNFLTNNLDESFPKHKFAYVQNSVLDIGRGSHLHPYVKRQKYINGRIECDNCGVYIESNGTLHGVCTGAIGACTVGHISTHPIKSLLEKMRKRRPKYLFTGEAASCWEICNKIGNKLMDPKWDRDHRENVRF